METPIVETLTHCTECNSEIDATQPLFETGILVCHSCRLCTICGGLCMNTEIKFCTKYNIPMSCARCRIVKDPVTGMIATDLEAELLNLCRLAIVPDVELSTETNVQRATLAASKIWEMQPIEGKYHMMKMMEAIYSGCYMNFKRDPSDVKRKLQERDIENTKLAHKKAAEERNAQLPSEKARLKREAQEKDKAEGNGKGSTSAKPDLSTMQAKFVHGMTRSGIPIEEARKIWESQGKVWVE